MSLLGTGRRRRAAVAALPAAGLLAGALLAGCGGTGDGAVAGTRVATPGATAAPGPGVPAAPGDPGLVAAADLPPCPDTAAVPAVPGGLPDLALPCLGEGPPVRLAGLRGTPTVVTVWASWCAPCLGELPVLAAAAEETQGAVRFLGIDLLDQPDRALQAVADLGVGFPSVSDPDGSARAALGIPGPPVTLFVRPDGTVAHRQVGAVPDRAALAGLLREHLGIVA